MPQVALIQMPIVSTQWPSLGISLLKAGLQRRGVTAKIHYFNLKFARRVEWAMYDLLMSGFPLPSDLAAEWVFAESLWGKDEALDDEYFSKVLLPAMAPFRSKGQTEGAASILDRFRAVRREVEPFLQACLDEVPWHEYRVVGFTSSFQQQMPSLSLARRLKERYPHLFIVFGGANMEDEMGNGLFQGFPFVDAVVSGEGDTVFPELLDRLLQGKPLGSLTGVFHRQNPDDLVVTEPELSLVAPGIDNMDELPYPDFDDFFEEFSAGPVPPNSQPYIVLETSRGCWWGAKAHCTFCGLNDFRLNFRNKSADRAIDEIRYLLDRYGHHTHRIIATDNIIPFEYFQTFLPVLRDLNLELDIFFETKANLKKSQLALYRAAGLRQIQPGVESLSTPVLKLIKKGITALQNIQMLKWCRQFGVKPYWNLLVGLPGEKPEYYAGTADLAKLLVHFPPPIACFKVRFDRFAPYTVKPEEHGVRNLKPYPAYYYIYRGLDDATVRKIAYFFVGEFDGMDQVDTYTAPVKAAVAYWHKHVAHSVLCSEVVGEDLVICDLRPAARRARMVLSGAQRVLYEACDSIASQGTLLRHLGEYAGHEVAESDLDALLQPLVDLRILLRDGNEYLALAIPLGEEYVLTGDNLARVNAVLAATEDGLPVAQVL